MRDILSKVMAGSMIAGAALLVAACSGGGNEANNTAGENLSTDVYNELPADGNIGGDLNATGNLGTGTDLNATGNVGGTTGTDAGNTTGNTTTNAQ